MSPRILPVVFAGFLIATSIAPTVGATDDPCQASVDVEPWQTPRSVEDDNFLLLFPGLRLVVTDDRSRLPEIPRLWAVGPAGFCPLGDLSGLIETHRGVLSSQAEFEAAAWLAALATDTEVMGVSLLQRFVDFQWVEPGLARVVLIAASPATGTEVEWTVTIAADGVHEARWTVLRLVPEIRADMRGWFIGPGDTGPFNAARAQGETLERLYPTHDGKFVRVTYYTEFYANEELAHEDADRNGMGAVLAYDLMKREWGFPSADPDEFLDVSVSGCACIFGDDQVDILMPPEVMAWLNSFDFTYSDPDETAYLILAHEFFHHFQWSMMGWNQGHWVLEGTARFIETVIWPKEAHQPGSIQYDPSVNGFSYVMMNPELRPQQHAYSYGLVWGHIYDTNGGIGFFKRLFEESAADPGFPGFVDRALVAMGGEHSSLGEALQDLGGRLVTRSFEWDTWDGSATYDWGVYLPDVKVEALADQGGSGTWHANVAPYALRFLRVPPTNDAAGVVTIAATGAPTIQASVITESAAGCKSEPFSGVYTNDEAVHMRHLFLVNDYGAPAPPSLIPVGQFGAVIVST